MNNLPFSEKYRPRKLDDLVLDEIIRVKIQNILDNKDIPNIIFTGNSGVGKTSTMHCLARLIYPRITHESVIELNASDDRGIKSVHETIINFCKRKVEFSDGYAQHKLLILDEADNITSKAQRLINSIMEKYPTTRFAFTCNNSTDIIESIQSRCLIIRFTKPPLEKFISRIEFICQNESIRYERDALEYLFELCNKDLRKTINTLELVAKSSNFISIPNILSISDIPSQGVLSNLLNYILEKDVRNVCVIVKDFKLQGYYSLDVLLHFIQFIKKKDDLLEDERIRLMSILSEKSYLMSKNISSYLQLTGAFLECIG